MEEQKVGWSKGQREIPECAKKYGSVNHKKTTRQKVDEFGESECPSPRFFHFNFRISLAEGLSLTGPPKFIVSLF